MRKTDFAVRFRFFYKTEIILGLILLGLSCLFAYGSVSNLTSYYHFRTDYADRLILGRLKVTYVKSATAKSSGRFLSGYIVGNKSLVNCNDCISISIGGSSTDYQGSEYYDKKYKSVSVGDTVPIWHTSDFKYRQIMPKNTKNDLLEFEYLMIKSFLTGVIEILIGFSLLFLFVRFMRKYYQKKYKITDEEYKKYVKIAFNKK